MIRKSKSITFWEKRGWRRYIGPKRLILLGIFGGGLAALHYLRLHGCLTPELVFRFIQEHQVSAPLTIPRLLHHLHHFPGPHLSLESGGRDPLGPVLGQYPGDVRLPGRSHPRFSHFPDGPGATSGHAVQQSVSPVAANRTGYPGLESSGLYQAQSHFSLRPA